MTNLDDNQSLSSIWPPPPNSGEGDTDMEDEEPAFLTRLLFSDLILGFVFGIGTFIIPVGLLLVLIEGVWPGGLIPEKIQSAGICGLVLSAQIRLLIRWWYRFPDFCLTMSMGIGFMVFITAILIFG